VLFEDVLDRGYLLRLKVTGRSMASFLDGGETLTLRKVGGASLHVGDLIFFRTARGSLLLHRILRKRSKDDFFVFQTKGDALRGMDEPVLEQDILGKVCTVEKSLPGGETKHLNMESLSWRTLNYMLALVHLLKSKTFSVLSRCS
jgi:signal peptidase I